MLSRTRAPRVPFRRRATDPAGCRAGSGKRRAATAAVGRRRERGQPISGAAVGVIGAGSLACADHRSRKVAFSLKARGRLSRSGHRCPYAVPVATQGARSCIHGRISIGEEALAAALARRRDANLRLPPAASGTRRGRAPFVTQLHCAKGIKPMVYGFSVFLFAAIAALVVALVADTALADRALKKRQTEPR
jgi:hypothetical protein